MVCMASCRAPNKYVDERIDQLLIKEWYTVSDIKFQDGYPRIYRFKTTPQAIEWLSKDLESMKGMGIYEKGPCPLNKDFDDKTPPWWRPGELGIGITIFKALSPPWDTPFQVCYDSSTQVTYIEQFRLQLEKNH